MAILSAEKIAAILAATGAVISKVAIDNAPDGSILNEDEFEDGETDKKPPVPKPEGGDGDKEPGDKKPKKPNPLDILQPDGKPIGKQGNRRSNNPFIIVGAFYPLASPMPLREKGTWGALR